MNQRRTRFILKHSTRHTHLLYNSRVVSGFSKCYLPPFLLDTPKHPQAEGYVPTSHTTTFTSMSYIGPDRQWPGSTTVRAQILIHPDQPKWSEENWIKWKNRSKSFISEHVYKYSTACAGSQSFFASTLKTQPQSLASEKGHDEPMASQPVNGCFMGGVQWHDSAPKQMVLIIFI